MGQNTLDIALYASIVSSACVWTEYEQAVLVAQIKLALTFFFACQVLRKWVPEHWPPSVPASDIVFMTMC